MQGNSTLILVEENKNLIETVNETNNHIVHQDFTLKPLIGRNQHSFECSSLFLSYSIRIKGYMPNLGPHLRQNRHHTLLHKQEQPCSQFGLHMHQHQPTITMHYHSCITIYRVTPCLFIRFTIGKTYRLVPQNGYKSVHIIGYKPCKSWDYVTVEFQVGLPVD
jgi:hypothetical protein